MSYMYTKEQMFLEFKDVTKKDQSKKERNFYSQNRLSNFT
jgi:hypothetical protein